MDREFRALVIRRDAADGPQRVAQETLTTDDLMEGDVTLRVASSTVNYKDGLAITGAMPVVRRFPMIPGIDAAGTVVASDNPDFRPGDAVVLNGWGVGEGHYGAYAGMMRVKGDWLVKLPDGLTPAQAMAVGTAGYTAMLAVMALERHGITPERGPMLVTGAAGGVGSVSVALLARLGFTVVAATGRPEEEAYLKGLGASEIVPRASLSEPGKPLARERWAGGIDSVGSHTLVNALAATMAGGAIAACGNAGGMDLPGSVAPFILRGVALLGINSVTVPRPGRVEAWRRIVRDLDLAKLDAMTRTIGFDAIEATARDIVAGKVRGRVVVDMDR